MATVTPDRVRNRLNLSSSHIGDSTVTEFIVDACAEIMAETGLTIDYDSCTEAEAACITDLDKEVRATCHSIATTNTFKSQLHYLLSNSYIARIARGIYQITPKGEKYLVLLTS